MGTVSVATRADGSFEAVAAGHSDFASRLDARFYEGSAETFRELAASWNKLAMEGPYSAPFFQPKWFETFSKAFEPHTRLVFVTVGASDTAVRGVLPLVRKNRFFAKKARFLKNIPARTLRSLSNTHSCRFDLVHAAEDKEDVAAATWKALKDAKHEWTVIEALDVPEGGAFESVMRCARRDGYLVGTWATKMSPYLALPAAGSDAFLNCSTRFKHARSGLKGKQKRLEKEGTLAVEIVDRAEPSCISTFFALEAAGWKGSNGSAILSHPEQIQFYTEIAHAAAECGEFRIASLTLNGKPIAMQFGFMRGGGYYVVKTTYDEGYGKFSPGQILVKLMIERLANEGMERYDFLGVRSLWKCVWTSTVLKHSNCYIFRPTIKGRVLYAMTMYGWRLVRYAHVKIKGDPQDIGIDLSAKESESKKPPQAQ